MNEDDCTIEPPKNPKKFQFYPNYSKNENHIISSSEDLGRDN
jgi:hypothetical protein